MTGLDPRGALVLDVRALGLPRRPGSMVTVTRSAPAPVDLGIAMASVPEGSPVELDVRLESVIEGVLVTGLAVMQVQGECARCLDPLQWSEEVAFRELFAYPATDFRGVVVEEPEGEDEALPVLEDDLIDLEPTLRDAVVLALPLAPLCREDCAGLCPECGVRLDDSPGHQHNPTDPRWAALEALIEQDENDR